MPIVRRSNLEKISSTYESQRELADILEITPGYLNQLLTGYRNIGEKTARKIERKLKLEEFTLDMQDSRAESNAEEGPELGLPSKVPVVGTAQLGDNGNWTELEYPVGFGDGYVEYPSRDGNAYAIRCIGNSMSPRIKDGEFVIVEPNTSYINGDEVMVKALDGRVMVKTYLYTRDNKVHLISVNDAYPPISIPLEQIEKIHFVGGITKKALWKPV